MTPEELNRTIDFIIQSQARLAAAQEQDRRDRLQSEKERLESEKQRLESEKQRLETEKQLRAFDQRLAGLLEIQVQLLETQSRRLDANEKESRAFRGEFFELMREIRVSLDRILDKLTDRLN